MATVELESGAVPGTSGTSQPRGATRSDTTRYLCAAVHLHARFRDKVLREILNNDYRAFGTSPGVDLVPVVEYAIAINRRKVWRNVALLALLVLALFGVGFAILALFAAFGVILAEAWVTQRRVARTLTRGRFDPDALKLEVGHHLQQRLNELNVAQQGNTVVYSGYSPFVGSGFTLGGWSFAINIRNGKEGTGGTLKPQTFALSELYGAISRSLAQIGFVGLTVEDKLYVNGAEVGHDPIFLPNRFSRPRATTDQQLVTAFLENPTQSIRHYKCIRVVSWKGELVLSMFLRFSLTGPSLFVESSHFLLPPLKDEFHTVDSYQPTLTAQQALNLIGRSLVATPFLWLFSWLLLLWRAVQPILNRQERQAVRSAIRENATFDYGAKPSLREVAASTSYSQYFQKLDEEMYFKTIERQILDGLTEFLDGRNIDTSDLKARQTTILNSGVLVSGGSVTAANLAVGTGANLVQGVARAAGRATGAAQTPVPAGR
jgi:hypothetical protein